MAIELAKRGFEVTFIEGIPPLASKLKQWFYSFSSGSQSINQQTSYNYPKLDITIPPVVPTSLRSSYVPRIDVAIFNRWFTKRSLAFNWERTILVVTFPYWWFGFWGRKKYPSKLIIYDICDSLEVPSRNSKSLKRMNAAEEALINETDIISFSAYEMERTLVAKNISVQTIHIPNAISKTFFNEIQNSSASQANKIGFIGALEPE